MKNENNFYWKFQETETKNKKKTLTQNQYKCKNYNPYEIRKFHCNFYLLNDKNFFFKYF